MALLLTRVRTVGGNVQVATNPWLRTTFAFQTAAAALAIVGTVAAKGNAQQIAVSGVVVQRRESSPISGAMVRVSGLASTLTDTAGRFRLEVAPGRHTLTVDALGYRRWSLDLTIRADTALRIELDPDPFALDTLFVQPRNVTVRGTIRDAGTRLKVLEAQVTSYPGARTVGAVSGVFTLSHLPGGSATTLVVEAPEYLPARTTLTPDRDTVLSIELRPDPVALRMIARQVERLDARARGVPISVSDLGQEEISTSGAQTVMDLMRRLLPPGTVPDRMPRIGRDRPCVFLDDIPFKFRDFYGFSPEGIDRIEVYGRRGDMIRVYTHRYVRGLSKVATLQRVVYMPIGTGPPTCR